MECLQGALSQDVHMMTHVFLVDGSCLIYLQDQGQGETLPLHFATAPDMLLRCLDSEAYRQRLVNSLRQTFKSLRANLELGSTGLVRDISATWLLINRLL